MGTVDEIGGRPHCLMSPCTCINNRKTGGCQAKLVRALIGGLTDVGIVAAASAVKLVPQKVSEPLPSELLPRITRVGTAVGHIARDEHESAQRTNVDAPDVGELGRGADCTGIGRQLVENLGHYGASATI